MFDVHAREPGLKPNHTQYLSLLHVRISELNVLSNQYNLIVDTRTRCQNRLSPSAKTIVSYSLIKLTMCFCLQVVKMLITIVTFFGLCWLPLHSFILVMEITNMDRWADSDLQKVLGHLYFVAHWLAMSNSFVNPIIYGFMNDNFRVSYVIIQMRQSLFSTSRSVHSKLHCCV